MLLVECLRSTTCTVLSRWGVRGLGAPPPAWMNMFAHPASIRETGAQELVVLDEQGSDLPWFLFQSILVTWEFHISGNQGPVGCTRSSWHQGDFFVPQRGAMPKFLPDACLKPMCAISGGCTDPHRVLCSGYLWFGEPAADQAAVLNDGLLTTVPSMESCQQRSGLAHIAKLLKPRLLCIEMSRSLRVYRTAGSYSSECPSILDVRPLTPDRCVCFWNNMHPAPCANCVYDNMCWRWFSLRNFATQLCISKVYRPVGIAVGFHYVKLQVAATEGGFMDR